MSAETQSRRSSFLRVRQISPFPRWTPRSQARGLVTRWPPAVVTQARPPGRARTGGADRAGQGAGRARGRAGHPAGKNVREDAAMAQIRAWQPDFPGWWSPSGRFCPAPCWTCRAWRLDQRARLAAATAGAARPDPGREFGAEGHLHRRDDTMIMDAAGHRPRFLLQDSIPIAPQETAGEPAGQVRRARPEPADPHPALAAHRSIAPHPQPTDERLISYAPQLKKEDGRDRCVAERQRDIDRHVAPSHPGGQLHLLERPGLKIIAGRPLPVELGL